MLTQFMGGYLSKLLHTKFLWAHMTPPPDDYMPIKSNFYQSTPVGEHSIITVISLSVCLPIDTDIFRTTIFTRLFVYVTHVSGSFLLWRRCDKFCTSGFVDDAMFAHNRLYGAGVTIRQHWTRVESNVYDCSVWYCIRCTSYGFLHFNITDILQFDVAVRSTLQVPIIKHKPQQQSSAVMEEPKQLQCIVLCLLSCTQRSVVNC